MWSTHRVRSLCWIFRLKLPLQICSYQIPHHATSWPKIPPQTEIETVLHLIVIIQSTLELRDQGNKGTHK